MLVFPGSYPPRLEANLHSQCMAHTKLGSIRIGHNLSNAFRSGPFQYDFGCNETFQHSDLEVIISAR